MPMSDDDNSSMIENVVLTASSERVNCTDPLTLELSFSVNGKIRDVFNRETWLYAYDMHDNLFRIKYTIALKSLGKDICEPIIFLRKASLYWSRDPTIEPYPPEKKVWAMIVMDNDSLLPRSVQEAQSLLFDVTRKIDLFTLDRLLGKGRHEIYAEVKASWGKHVYINANELSARSNKVTIECV
jgi:hypothetical protein